MKFYCRAVNKWCVTGTPMNTSLKDLKGQLSFLGIEDKSDIFSSFSKDLPTCSKVTAGELRRNEYRYFNSTKQKDSPGRLLFTLRNIMMRHSIQMKSRTEQRSIMSLPPKVSFKSILKFYVCFIIYISHVCRNFFV